MTRDATEPAAIEQVGGELAIRWTDGHESFYTPGLLRENCPCAMCKVRREKLPRSGAAESGRTGSPPSGPFPMAQDTPRAAASPFPASPFPASPFPMFTPSVAASPGILATEPVGRYALRFHWSDRHDSGIYDFRLLRELCPCEECRARRIAPAGTGRIDPSGR
jgi:DUF971 family protein